MTKEEAIEWFKNRLYGVHPDSEEKRYQAYKARLADEATLNAWPDENR